MLKRALTCVLTLTLVLFMAACGGEDTSSTKVSTPSSSKEFEGEHFQDVVNSLTKAGFTDVEPKGLEDLITGWLKKDGSVESVAIDGSNTFANGSSHPKDAKVIVSYHSFKPGEDGAEVTESPKVPESASTTESPNPTAGEETLTVANNKDLALLLASTDPFDVAKEFVAKYQGRTIEFDGNIGNMLMHGNYKTRYDILINSGDFNGPATGPNFQFNDVNIVTDLNLTGPNVPETISEGMNLHIIAKVEKYNTGGDLLLLEPVSTKVR